MSEREPDDTPKPADAPTPAPARPPGAYYYDDATGYEPYRPDEDDDEDDDEDRETEVGSRNDERGRRDHSS